MGVENPLGLGINREDLDLLSRTVARLGGYAEGLFDYHEFGFDKAALREHITRVSAFIHGLKDVAGPGGIPLRPPNIPPGAFWEDQGETWNYLQTLRFAAGATMMKEQWRPYMSPQNLQRALTAQIFPKCQIGILDDLFHKESLFSIPKMRKLSEAFYAPSEDLTWWEKLGAHTSAATMYNLIDMAFTNEHFDLKGLPNFLTGWYYYDAAIILMDHIVSIYQDLRNGIANLSLIAMRKDELSGLTTLKGYNPHLTIDDYDQHLRRIAYLTSKGLEFVDKDFHDESMYYPFITIMMPVVMMADWIGNRDDMIHAFLDSIAPAIKRVAGNGNVPTRAIVEVADEVGRPA